MKSTFILTAFLVNSLFVLAQTPTQTLRGRVTDETSKAPIAYATVVLLNTDPLIGTTTDAEGYFKIEGLAVRRYDLQLSFLGYEPVVFKEILLSSAKETYLNIGMKESVTTLGEVVVRPKVVKEAPLNNMATLSARMLSVEEAKRYAGGFDDPARLASSFAGVASNVANNGIVIRGNAPKSLQWKLEGVEIPNPNHFADLSAFGGGGLTALSSQMLANSDFLTGAFPAEYHNALSGVFDIFMRSGNNEKREHSFQLGIIGIDFSSEGPFSKKAKSSYLFNYRYSTLGLISPLLPAEAQGTRYQDLSFKLNFPTRKAGVLSLWGIGLLDRSGQMAETDSTKWLYQQNREESTAKQYMGAIGLSHDFSFTKNAHLKTSLAATISGLDWKRSMMNRELTLLPASLIKSNNANFVLSSSLDRKLNARHTHKAGISITGLAYNMLLKDGGRYSSEPVTLVEEQGLSTLISAFSSSAVRLSDKFTMNLGLNVQLFSLNRRYTIEPRAGIKWHIDEKHTAGAAYGLHSRLEKLNFYFTKAAGGGLEQINKRLDFTKAHHFVLSYGVKLSDNLIFKAEPYYQHLFNVPVIPDSSFSFINLQDQWFIDQKLENKGKGRNYGLDLTLERYLSDGFYFLFTASLFNSEFLGGDAVWRNSRFNRHYLFNALAGREWFLGKDLQNRLGLNVRFTFQGGDPYTPVDEEASGRAKEVVYNNTQLFARQMPPSLLAHFTFSYQLNRQAVAHTFALKVLNASMYSDFYGFRYNYIAERVDEHREAIVVPNLSYKIEF